MSMIQHTAYASDDNLSILVVMRGTSKELEMNCTPQQYENGMRAYNSGSLIQQAFNFLTVDEREFLMSGILPGEYFPFLPNQEDYEDEESPF